MKKLYKYVMLLILLCLNINLFTMCSDKSNKEQSEIEENVIISGYTEEDKVEGEEVVEAEEVEEDEVRQPRTIIKGNNEDVVTLMIYMCGSDLESKYGTGSVDINEILQANINDNVNIIIETGGTTDWTNESISDNTNQIFKVKDNKLVLEKDDLGMKNMADPNTLTEFINYSKTNYPANRYGLIIWNHGYGALEGFAKDENFNGDNMEVNNLASALEESDTFFDFIGFDACFMSTIEVAYTLEDYADYLIASAEIEPFAGWYYTNWISELANNTSMATEDLGKIIIDDFVTHNTKAYDSEPAILSFTDLTKINYLYNNLCTLLKEINDKLSEGAYDEVSLARSETKTFAENLIDHIDIRSLAQNINSESAKNVISALEECVKYRGRTDTMEDVGGLSIYFPYYKMNYYNKFINRFNDLDLKDEHVNFIINMVEAVKEKKIEVIGTARKFDDDKEADINRYSSN